ncbi:MAG: type II secretion system protein [Planctomycetota bacterium]
MAARSGVRGREGRAFTLVELLVVVAIISLLAAVLLPVTARVRGFARRTECVSNLTQLGKAVNLYADDYDHWYPCACVLPSTEPEPGLPRIRVLLVEYAAAEVFECPDDQPTDPEYPFPSYVEGEGSSYEWAEMCNHLKIGQPVRYAPFKLKDIPILRDYEPFHRGSGSTIGVNGLFHDGHVQSF